MDSTVVTIVGNLVALSGGLWFFADRFRRWIDKKVAEPVERIEHKVDQQDSTIQDLTKRVDLAHSRIDDLLLIEKSNTNA
jgi:hypothetical protein